MDINTVIGSHFNTFKPIFLNRNLTIGVLPATLYWTWRITGANFCNFTLQNGCFKRILNFQKPWLRSRTILWKYLFWTFQECAYKEKKRESVLEGVPKSLPGLLRSRRIQERAASVGFDWKEVDTIISKVEEELNEVRHSIDENDKDQIELELGDLLFSVVNLSRFYNIDPENALKRSTNKFINRFNKIEKIISESGKSMENSDLETMDKIWNEVKIDEKNN